MLAKLTDEALRQIANDKWPDIWMDMDIRVQAEKELLRRCDSAYSGSNTENERGV
jgi:hypothetical protein